MYSQHVELESTDFDIRRDKQLTLSFIFEDFEGELHNFVHFSNKMGCMNSQESTTHTEVINNRAEWEKLKKKLALSRSQYDTKRRDRLWDLIDRDRSGSLAFAEVERSAIKDLGLGNVFSSTKEITPIIVRAFNASKAIRQEMVLSGADRNNSVFCDEGSANTAKKNSLSTSSRTGNSSSRSASISPRNVSAFSPASDARQSIVSKTSKNAVAVAQANTDENKNPRQIQSGNNNQTERDGSTTHLEDDMGNDIASRQLISAAAPLNNFIGGTATDHRRVSFTNQIGSQPQMASPQELMKRKRSSAALSVSSVGSGENNDDNEENNGDNREVVPTVLSAGLDTGDNNNNNNPLAPPSSSAVRPQVTRTSIISSLTHSPAIAANNSTPSYSHQSQPHDENGLPKSTSPSSRRATIRLSIAQKEKFHQLQREEFRLFLMYIADFMELYFAFEAIDKSGDKKVTITEFIAAVPLLEKWGIQIGNAREQFALIDVSHNGTISFKEFSDWAIKEHIHIVK